MAAQVNFACLTYHVIADGGDTYAVSEQQLRGQLRFLKAEGFVVEGFEQLETRLRTGRPWPDRYTVLTLDDGDESNMRAADLLAEHEFRATFFVTRDRSQKKPGYIREIQIRELRRRGFSLGTHGTTHRKLTFLSPRECHEELEGSRQWLADTLGEPVRYMAAPGGFINRSVFSLAQHHGYVLVGTCREKMNSPADMNLPSLVSRVNVRRHFSRRQFADIVYGSSPFYLWRQLRSAALVIPKQLVRT